MVKKDSKKVVSAEELEEISDLPEEDLQQEKIADEELRLSSKKQVEVTEKNENTMKLFAERDIAMDFATKVYKKFTEMIKSVILFGSSAKKVSTPDSDIDIIVIIDDVSIKWDLELIAWYREELGKIISANPYRKSLHINTVKLSSWWSDLIRGDPVVVNVIRYGDPLIDFGGFFSPLKILLQDGKIQSTPEAIYTLLQRAPTHMARARASMLAAVDGLYWACVDSAHAALIAAKIMPPSPEHITLILKEQFVDKGMLKMKQVDFYNNIHFIAKDIVHGKTNEVSGKDIDELIKKADEFMGEMAKLVDVLVEKK
jgi:predicted nucleotidyltransferase/uncharacterized protein (UPF0332 family)